MSNVLHEIVRGNKKTKARISINFMPLPLTLTTATNFKLHSDTSLAQLPWFIGISIA